MSLREPLLGWVFSVMLTRLESIPPYTGSCDIVFIGTDNDFCLFSFPLGFRFVFDFPWRSCGWMELEHGRGLWGLAYSSTYSGCRTVILHVENKISICVLTSARNIGGSGWGFARASGGSRISQRRAPITEVGTLTYYYGQFPPKTGWKQKNWTQRGVRVLFAPPLGSVRDVQPV